MSTAKGPGSIPGQGTKIPQATWYGKGKKKNISAIYASQSNHGLPVNHSSKKKQYPMKKAMRLILTGALCLGASAACTDAPERLESSAGQQPKCRKIFCLASKIQFTGL